MVDKTISAFNIHVLDVIHYLKKGVVAEDLAKEFMWTYEESMRTIINLENKGWIRKDIRSSKYFVTTEARDIFRNIRKK